MVKTPRTRSGGAKQPATIDLPPEDVRRMSDAPAPPAPDSPETAFAAEESLTPGERTAPRPSLLDAPETGAASGTATPEAAEAADSFRFSEALPGDPPADPPQAAEPPTEARPASEAAAQTEETGPQPGDASTPLFADPAPDEAPDAWPAAGAAPPGRTGPRMGRLAVAGFIGGAAALLLAALLQYLGGLPSVSPDGRIDVEAMRTELQALRGDVAALRESRAAPDASLSAALDTLRGDVAALQGAGAAAQALTDRLGALEGKVQGLESGAVTADQIAPLGQRADAAGALAQENKAALDAAAKRLDALDGMVSAMSGKVESLGAQPGIALALAASGLKEAAERGAPFEAELATLKAIAPDLPQIAQLQPYAAGGLATRAAIGEAWNDTADAMVATENQPDPDAGLASRLWSSATGLVSVRPVGAVEGSSTSAVVARMDAAVQAGDLARALAEYDALPEAARQAGAAWAEKARARVSAEALIDAAIADAMKAS